MPFLFGKRELSGAERCAFAHPVTARFQDVDAAGLVFFARIPAWLHDGYFAWLAAEGVDLPAMMEGSPVVAPVQHAETDYFHPVRFGDRLRVEVVRVHVDGPSFTVGMRLVRDQDDAVVAVGQQCHVMVSRETLERAPLPEDFARALESVR